MAPAQQGGNNELTAGRRHGAMGMGIALSLVRGGFRTVGYDVENDYSPLSAVDIFVRDLGIVLETGKVPTFALPVAASAHRMFLAASSAGYGREDDAAAVKAYRDLTGIKLPGDEPA